MKGIGGKDAGEVRQGVCVRWRKQSRPHASHTAPAPRMEVTPPLPALALYVCRKRRTASALLSSVGTEGAASPLPVDRACSV